MDQKNEQKEINEINTTLEKKEEEKGVSEEKKIEEDEIESNWTEKVDTFDELKLNELLLRGVYGYGFSKPSPIQQRGILPLLLKRDTIAQVKFTY